jgi:hypothetical protein
MTVRLEENAITLSGACGVEEVEDLISHIESRPDLAVDIGAATAIHTALWQALMVFKPTVIGTPMSSLIAGKLLPGLCAYLDETEQRPT